jgi:methionyl-tRNA formyltransferase
VLGLDPLIVACATDAIEVLELQRAGRRPAPAAEFLRGARLAVGAVLA